MNTVNSKKNTATRFVPFRFLPGKQIGSTTVKAWVTKEDGTNRQENVQIPLYEDAKGKELFEARKQTGLLLGECAVKVGISQKTMASLEIGSTTMPAGDWERLLIAVSRLKRKVEFR